MKAYFLALAAMMLFGCTPETTEPAGAHIDWITDYQRGIARAQESGKSAMVFFTADWCPPCQELKKQVFSDSRVIDASRALVNINVDVDVDKNQQIIRDYQVRGIPAIFFLNSNGQPVATFNGPRSVQNFVKHMQAAAGYATSS